MPYRMTTSAFSRQPMKRIAMIGFIMTLFKYLLLTTQSSAEVTLPQLVTHSTLVLAPMSAMAWESCTASSPKC